jgi:hypothetical protein
MKKAAGVLIILICLIGGGLLIKINVSQKPVSSAVFLPENVLFYHHQSDFSKNYSMFLDTKFGETIGSFNIVELALDLGFPLEVVDSLRELQNLAISREADTIFNEFFTNDCSLALLSGVKQKDILNYLKTNLVLFTEPVHSAQTLGVIIDKIGEEYNITSTQYGNHIIYRVRRSAEFAITFVSVEGKTIFTLNERTLRHILDRYDRQEPNFTENYFFAEFQKNNNKAAIFSYFEISSLGNILEILLNDPSSKQEKSNFIALLQGFTTGIFSSSWQGGSFKNTISLHYNSYLVDQDILHFLHFPPEKDIHISTSPKDTLLYFWMNTFDVRRLWDVFVKKTNIQRAQLESIEENIALTAGIPFDSLLDLFGNKFHFILRKPSAVDPVPLPNFTMIFELTDAEKAQSTLQHLFLLNKIPHGNDIYRDIPFTYWGNDMQTGLQPVYSIHDNYLYISSSVEMQLDIIMTMFEGNGLTSFYPFSNVGKPLLKENNSSCFLKVEEFVDFFKEFISLGEAMFSRQNREFAFQTKTLVYDITFPLLESMKMYSSVSSVSEFENGTINIEIDFNPADF